MNDTNHARRQNLNHERRELLQQLEGWFEAPMLVLGIVWPVLLVVEFIGGN